MFRMWNFVVSILALLVLLCQALVVFAVKHTELWGESDLWKRSFGYPNFVGLSWGRGSASGQGGVGQRGAQQLTAARGEYEAVGGGAETIGSKTTRGHAGSDWQGAPCHGCLQLDPPRRWHPDRQCLHVREY